MSGLTLPPSGGGADVLPWVADGGIAVVAFVTGGYVDMLANLDANCAAMNVPWRPLVLCADDVAVTRVAAMAPSLPTLALKDALGAEHAVNAPWRRAVEVQARERGAVASDSSTQALRYATSPWVPLMFDKLTALRDVVRAALADPARGVNVVLYLDADIHLFEDPIPAIRGALAAHPDVELLAQCDEFGVSVRDGVVFAPCGGNGGHTGSSGCPALCAGVMALRVCDRVAAALDYAPRVQRPLRAYDNADQTYVNEAVTGGQLTAAALPRRLFPNGRFVLTGAVSLLPDPVLLHYNWLVGEDKKTHMRTSGHWYLAPG